MSTFYTGCVITSRTFVGLTLISDFPPSCSLSHPVLPISHQPKQNLADGGTISIKANPTKVREVMAHPVGYVRAVYSDYLLSSHSRNNCSLKCAEIRLYLFTDVRRRHEMLKYFIIIRFPKFSRARCTSLRDVHRNEFMI